MSTGSWVREPAMILVTALVAALYLYGYGDKISRTDGAQSQVELHSAVSLSQLPIR